MRNLEEVLSNPQLACSMLAGATSCFRSLGDSVRVTRHIVRHLRDQLGRIDDTRHDERRYMCDVVLSNSRSLERVDPRFVEPRGDVGRQHLKFFFGGGFVSQLMSYA